MIRHIISALRFSGRIISWLLVFKLADIVLAPFFSRLCRSLRLAGYPV